VIIGIEYSDDPEQDTSRIPTLLLAEAATACGLQVRAWEYSPGFGSEPCSPVKYDQATTVDLTNGVLTVGFF